MSVDILASVYGFVQIFSCPVMVSYTAMISDAQI